MERCERHDCRFRVQESIEQQGEGPQCDYAGRTGRTRLGQIYKELGINRFDAQAAYYADPARCPFYEREVGMDTGARKTEREGTVCQKKKALPGKLRSFVEWQLEQYYENRRRLREEQRGLTELKAVDWSLAGGGPAPGRPAESAAERLETDRYIWELKRSTEAVERVLERISEEDRKLVELVYWRKILSVAGAASRLHISRRTAYRHIEGVLAAIAGEMGYVKFL